MKKAKKKVLLPALLLRLAVIKVGQTNSPNSIRENTRRQLIRFFIQEV